MVPPVRPIRERVIGWGWWVGRNLALSGRGFRACVTGSRAAKRCLLPATKLDAFGTEENKVVVEGTEEQWH
jgi:hypothetical protein